MLYAVHWLIVAAYLLLPVGALVWSVRKRMGGDRRMLRSLVLTGIAGVLLSLGMSLIYAIAADGRVLVGQVLLGAYFATGLLLLLKGFDWGVRQALLRSLPFHRSRSRG